MDPHLGRYVALSAANRAEVFMAYPSDPATPRPHDVPPDDLVELAAKMTTPPTPLARELIISLARQHPRWGVEFISASIRNDPGRHDVTIPQIARVLLEVRWGMRAPDAARAEDRRA